MSQSFIEVTVHNHQILHGFDENNQEIIEEIKVDTRGKKLVAVNRIKSLSEKYILTDYGFGRWIYWEYEESYEEVKNQLMGLGLK